MSRQRIILRNNGTISALGHSQCTGAKNCLIVPGNQKHFDETKQSEARRQESLKQDHDEPNHRHS